MLVVIFGSMFVCLFVDVFLLFFEIPFAIWSLKFTLKDVYTINFKNHKPFKKSANPTSNFICLRPHTHIPPTIETFHL